MPSACLFVFGRFWSCAKDFYIPMISDHFRWNRRFQFNDEIYISIVVGDNLNATALTRSFSGFGFAVSIITFNFNFAIELCRRANGLLFVTQMLESHRVQLSRNSFFFRRHRLPFNIPIALAVIVIRRWYRLCLLRASAPAVAARKSRVYQILSRLCIPHALFYRSVPDVLLAIAVHRMRLLIHFVPLIFTFIRWVDLLLIARHAINWVCCGFCYHMPAASKENVGQSVVCDEIIRFHRWHDFRP